MAKSMAELEPKLLATAPVGLNVLWYRDGQKSDNPMAALVTKVEDVGRLCLVVFGPNRMPEHKSGVYHVSHERVVNKGPLARVGAWDFVSSELTPRGVYDLARQEQERIKKAAAEQELRMQSLRKQHEEAKRLSNEDSPQPV